MTKDRVLPVASPADTLLRELSALPSTQVQNRFGGVLDDLRSHGTIVIERHDRPAAVLMSVEAYTQLHARAQPSQQLNLLTAQFDALVARMQTSKAAKGFQQAFAASPSLLAAVSAATTRELMVPRDQTPTAGAVKPKPTPDRRIVPKKRAADRSNRRSPPK